MDTGVVTYGRIFHWVLALSLFALLATPFAHDLWNRYVYIKEVYQLSDPLARVELARRYGTLTGFVDDVVRRCRQLDGAGQTSCMRYAVSLRGQ